MTLVDSTQASIRVVSYRVECLLCRILGFCETLRFIEDDDDEQRRRGAAPT